MSITIISNLSAKNESVEEFAKQMKKNMPHTRSFEGCEGVTVYRDSKSPSKFITVSTWASNEALEKYVAWRATQEDSHKYFSSSDTTRGVYSIFDE